MKVIAAEITRLVDLVTTPENESPPWSDFPMFLECTPRKDNPPMRVTLKRCTLEREPRKESPPTRPFPIPLPVVPLKEREGPLNIRPVRLILTPVKDNTPASILPIWRDCVPTKINPPTKTLEGLLRNVPDIVKTADTNFSARRVSVPVNPRLPIRNLEVALDCVPVKDRPPESDCMKTVGPEGMAFGRRC